MAGKGQRRPGESTADWRKRQATARRAERETARGEAKAGEQAEGLGDVAPKTGGGEPMPKQKDYGTTKEWMTALRQWRERKRSQGKD